MEGASELLEEIFSRCLSRGRSIRDLAVVALYAVSRRCGVGVTLDEIAHAAKTDRKVVARCYRRLVKELSLRIPPVKLSQYIAWTRRKLNLEDIVVENADSFLRAIEKSGMAVGRDPRAIVGATIYLASRMLKRTSRTQRELSDVLGVTEFTIRKTCRYLERLVFECHAGAVLGAGLPNHKAVRNRSSFSALRPAVSRVRHDSVSCADPK
jgi:transcription initiation factor TFIIB